MSRTGRWMAARFTEQREMAAERLQTQQQLALHHERAYELPHRSQRIDRGPACSG